MALTTKQIWTPDAGDNYNLIPDLATMAGTIDTALDAAVRPNMVINGDFRINQRAAVSGASVALSAYFLDRWYNPASACAYTWSVVDGVTVLTIPAGATGEFRVSQKIEVSDIIPDAPVVVSWEGDATCIGIENGSTITSWSASPLVITPTGDYDLEIRFGNQSTTDPRTLANVKVERGTIPTPFLRRSIHEERSACQRYYARFQGTGGAVIALGQVLSSGLTSRVAVSLPVPMRATPTVTINDLTVIIGTTNLTVTSVNAIYDAPGAGVASIDIAHASSTVGVPAGVRLNSAAAYLAFDAEL